MRTYIASREPQVRNKKSGQETSFVPVNVNIIVLQELMCCGEEKKLALKNQVLKYKVDLQDLKYAQIEMRHASQRKNRKKLTPIPMRRGKLADLDMIIQSSNLPMKKMTSKSEEIKVLT